MLGSKERYATKAATVRCSALDKGTISVEEIRNHVVKANGKLLLTASGAKLTGNGVCKIQAALTGNPTQPCTCKYSCTLAGWQKVSENKARGSPLLLTTSFNQCRVGGRITINEAGQKEVSKDAHISVLPIASLSVTALSEPKQDTTSMADAPWRQGETKKAGHQSDNKPQKSSEKKAARKIPFIPRTGLLCSCSETNPEKKCEDCSYRLDRRTSPVVADNSKTLSTNYDNARDKHDKYDRYFDEIFGLYAEKDAKQTSLGVKRGWSTVAHHIISGKQVLEEFPRLVKLARFCGYDVDNASESKHGINHYPNCIMLVGYPSDYGKLKNGLAPSGKKEREFAKSSDADEVMREAMMQWHVGSHQYRFAKDEKKKLRSKSREEQEKRAAGDSFHRNMRTVLGKRREFRGQDLTIACYANLVKARLQELEDELKANPVCYKNNESFQKDFIHRMEAISGEIKKKLAAFQEKPHRSYPYFVSLEAYLYAFAIPRTVHAVLVRSYRHGMRLTPWRITRYAGTLQDHDKSLSFEPDGEGMYIHSLQCDGKNNEEVITCLKTVCRATRYFLLADDLEPKALPFLEDAEKDKKGGTAYFFRLREREKSEHDLLQGNDSDIATWLRQVAKKVAQRDDLQGDAGVLRARLIKWKNLTARTGGVNT